MDADEVGARQGGVEIADRFAAGRAHLIGRDVRIVHQHIHVHGETALGGARADPAEADDEQGLAHEIDGQRAQPLAPAAGPDQAVDVGSAFCQRHHHEQRLLGDRGRIGGADHHQRNAAAREHRHVDGVIADADARHDLQSARPGAFGLAEARETENHPVDLAVRSQQRVEIARRYRGRKRDRLDVLALLEHVPAGGAHDVGNQDSLLVACHVGIWNRESAVKNSRIGTRKSGSRAVAGVQAQKQDDSYGRRFCTVHVPPSAVLLSDT